MQQYCLDEYIKNDEMDSTEARNFLTS